jgi:hypothetical protein
MDRKEGRKEGRKRSFQIIQAQHFINLSSQKGSESLRNNRDTNIISIQGIFRHVASLHPRKPTIKNFKSIRTSINARIRERNNR